MRKLFLILSVIGSFTAYAEDVHREPAMENSGPTVVLDTVDEPHSGAVNWEFNYIGDLGRNFMGGYRTGSTYFGVAAGRAHVDLDKAIGLEGGSFFFHLQGMHGGVPSTITGDAQIASNIESYSNRIRVMETWYKQSFYNEQFNFLTGLLDLNAEFNLTDSSLLFVNSSFGLGTEIAQLGPDGRTASTFPVTSLAGLIQYLPTKEIYLDTAIFDANPGAMETTGTKIKVDEKREGFMLISELGWKSDESLIAIGGWTYTKPYDHVYDLDQNGESKTARNYGSYFIAEHHFSNSISAFFRYGAASESANKFKDNLALGFTADGSVWGREKDRLGLGLTRVGTSHAYQRMAKRDDYRVEEAETVIELTYKYRLTKQLSLQPDLQYIIDPGMNPTFTNALTGFLRIQYDYQK